MGPPAETTIQLICSYHELRLMLLSCKVAVVVVGGNTTVLKKSLHMYNYTYQFVMTLEAEKDTF